MNQHRREASICQVCGEIFSARVDNLKNGFGRTCSRRCAGQWSRNQRSTCAMADLASLGTRSDDPKEIRRRCDEPDGKPESDQTLHEKRVRRRNILRPECRKANGI